MNDKIWRRIVSCARTRVLHSLRRSLSEHGAGALHVSQYCGARTPGGQHGGSEHAGNTGLVRQH